MKYEAYLFSSPVASKSLLRELQDSLLYSIFGVLYHVYKHPERWFSNECRVIVCRDVGGIIGVLFVAKGCFYESNMLEDAWGASHYGSLAVYVSKKYRRKGIAKTMIKILLALDDQRYLMERKVFLKLMLDEALHRGIGVYSLEEATVVSADEITWDDPF